jgi:hypothetical protein
MRGGARFDAMTLTPAHGRSRNLEEVTARGAKSRWRHNDVGEELDLI